MKALGPLQEILVRIRPHAGMFDTGQMQKGGWTAALAVLKTVLELLGTREPRKIEPTKSELAHRAKSKNHRTTLELRCAIPEIEVDSISWAMHEISVNCTPEAIAGIAPTDVRFVPLRDLNHALAESCFRVDILIGESAVVLENLARVPFCRRDDPWGGSEIVRTSDWNTDHRQIRGSSTHTSLVIIDLMRLPAQFDALMAQRAIYVEVAGRGYTNAAGLRITDVHRIEASSEDFNSKQRPLKL